MISTDIVHVSLKQKNTITTTNPDWSTHHPSCYSKLQNICNCWWDSMLDKLFDLIWRRPRTTNSYKLTEFSPNSVNLEWKATGTGAWKTKLSCIMHLTCCSGWCLDTLVSTYTQTVTCTQTHYQHTMHRLWHAHTQWHTNTHYWHITYTCIITHTHTHTHTHSYTHTHTNTHIHTHSFTTDTSHISTPSNPPTPIPPHTYHTNTLSPTSTLI